MDVNMLSLSICFVLCLTMFACEELMPLMVRFRRHNRRLIDDIITNSIMSSSPVTCNEGENILERSILNHVA